MPLDSPEDLLSDEYLVKCSVVGAYIMNFTFVALRLFRMWCSETIASMRNAITPMTVPATTPGLMCLDVLVSGALLPPLSGEVLPEVIEKLIVVGS